MRIGDNLAGFVMALPQHLDARVGLQHRAERVVASQTEHAELQPDLFQLVVEQGPRGARFVICRLLLREPGGGIGNG